MTQPKRTKCTCSCEECRKAVVDEYNPMLKHWSRCSDKELFAKIVYKAITTHHACQDARMKKLVSVATNRLVGNSSFHHVKKAYEVMVR